MRPRDLPMSKQKGIMLLEALLGILIFSLGILAVVGMQAMSVRTVAESKYRMDASFLANEVMGEMWANRSNLALYAYTGGTPPAVLANWTAKVESALPGVEANPPEIAVGAGNERGYGDDLLAAPGTGEAFAGSAAPVQRHRHDNKLISGTEASMRTSHFHSYGFSLVEILVAMVIALLGTIIIFQVFAVSEGIRRTSTSGGDAQQFGALALFTLERDVRVAGYGKQFRAAGLRRARLRRARNAS